MLDNALTRATRTAPVHRDPLWDLTTRLLGRGWPSFVTDTEGSQGWLPAVDIKETEAAFVAQADLPGLRKEDIDVAIEDNLLTISGERKLESETGDGEFHRVERRYGSFRRSFALPRGIDAGKVEAKFEDGVLTLTLPKAESARARKIAVS